ncbi:hypothetical protein V6N13_119982 [Hibiscus sabdariffa]
MRSNVWSQPIGDSRRRQSGKVTQYAWTDRGILQEEGRVEEASDARQSAPPRHPWPRHRPRRLWHLSGRGAGLQQGLCPFLLSSSSSTIFFSLSLRSGVDFQWKEQSLDIVMFQFPSVVFCNKLHTDI